MDERLSVPKDLMPYARAYEGLGDAVTISDPNDTLVFINSAGEELYGYARSELVGRPLSRILPAGAQSVSAEMLQSSQNGKWEGEVTRARKGGEEFRAQLTVTLLRNENDIVIGTVGIVRDLTEIRRLASEYAVLAEVGRIIGSTLDIDEVYERFASEVAEMIPCDTISIVIPDAAREYSTIAYMSGIAMDDRKRGDRLALEGTLALRAVQSMSTVLMQGVTREYLEAHIPVLVSYFDKGLRSFLSVPLTHHDRLVGVLQVRSTGDSAYSETNVALAERVGSQIAGAVANSLLHTQLQDAESEQRRLAEEQAVLAEIGRIITSSSSIDEVYQSCAEKIRQLIPCDRVAINLIDFHRNMWTSPYVSGMDLPDQELRPSIPLEGTFTAAAVKNRLTMSLDEAPELETQYPGLAAGLSAGLKSFLGVPLRSRDEIIGALILDSVDPDAYDDSSLDLAQRVADQMSGAIANAQLHAQLQVEADEGEALANIGRIISSLDIDEVYERFAGEVRGLIDFDQILISTIDLSRWTATGAYVFGLETLGLRVGETISLDAVAAGPDVVKNLVENRSTFVFQPNDRDELLSQVPGFVRHYDAGLRSFLIVPLISAERVVGTLVIRSRKPKTYTNRDVRVAERVAGQIAGAIASAELHAAVQQAAHESEVLANVSRSLSSSTDLNDILDTYARAVGEIIPVDAAGIGLIDHESQTVTPRHVTVKSEIVDLPTRDGRVAFPLEGSISAEALEKGSAVVVLNADPSQPGERFPQLLGVYQAGIRSFLAVPVIVGDQVTAVLHFSATDPDAYGPDEVAFAEKVATQISGAVAIAQLYERLKGEAIERETLATIGRIITSTLDVNEIYRCFAEELRKLISFDRISIMIADLEADTLTSVYVAGMDIAGWSAGDVFSLPDSVNQRAIQSKKGHLLEWDSKGLAPEERRARALVLEAGLRSGMTIPLISNDQVIGIFNLRSKEANAYEPKDLELGERVGAQVAGAIANAHLFEERRRAEEALRLTQLSVDQSVDSAFWIGPSAQFIYVNDAACRGLGYSRQQLLSMTVHDIDLESSPKDWPAHWKELTERGSLTFESQHKAADGRIFPVEITANHIEFEGEEYNFAFARDLSRRKELERQLRQSQKMEAVGTLAGGVAHDFNNMLTVVMNYAHLGQMKLSQEDPLSDYLGEIQKASERAANLTRQLLLFSRHQMIEPKVLSLNELILDMDRMLRRLIDESIEMVVLPASDLGLVSVDPGHMEQVLVNLVVNARDAMPEGGNLIIKTSGELLDDKSASHRAGLPAGEYVILEVSDTGIGMTEDVRSHIFEPFFTTKEVGKGTGLGLSTCYGIVKQHGGHIFAVSAPGRGTKFEVFLPGVHEPAAHPPEGDHITPSPLGTETLLLVEDESSVRSAIALSLRNQGYTVLEAANGEEALRIVDNSHGSTDLVLTDVVMPLMSGKELVNRLDVEHPGMRVVFMSGYTDAMSSQSVADARAEFIQKPFRPEELMLRIRDALDKREAPPPTASLGLTPTRQLSLF